MNGLNKDLPHYWENYGCKSREHQSNRVTDKRKTQVRARREGYFLSKSITVSKNALLNTGTFILA